MSAGAGSMTVAASSAAGADGEISSSVMDEANRLERISGSAGRYVRLNVGGTLHYTTIGTLISQGRDADSDSMLRAMFSGRMEVLLDKDGWVLIDRCGAHFPLILNYLRDGTVAALPHCRRQVMEILAEAKYYCLQGLIDACQAWLDNWHKEEDAAAVCRVPIISSQKEERTLLESTDRPAIKLLLNRHNNKYSYTNQSDDNLLRNLELFDKLVMRFNERILFIKDISAANEVCSWSFYGKGRKVAEVTCTSIVYATDKKHTKVEFAEARIYEEAMNILLYEETGVCYACQGTITPTMSGSMNAGAATLPAQQTCSSSCSSPPPAATQSSSAGGGRSLSSPTQSQQQNRRQQQEKIQKARQDLSKAN